MPAPTQTPSSLLPPPQTFDFLAPLPPLLSRLLLSPQRGGTSSLATSPAATSPPSIANNNNDPTAEMPLSPKDLPAAIQQIYARISKARQVVRGMDGVAMSVEEQEGVMRELEGEVERGRGVLEGLRGRATGAVG